MVGRPRLPVELRRFRSCWTSYERRLHSQLSRLLTPLVARQTCKKLTKRVRCGSIRQTKCTGGEPGTIGESH